MFHPINTEDIYIFFFLRFSLTINKKKNFFPSQKKLVFEICSWYPGIFFEKYVIIQKCRIKSLAIWKKKICKFFIHGTRSQNTSSHVYLMRPCTIRWKIKAIHVCILFFMNIYSNAWLHSPSSIPPISRRQASMESSPFSLALVPRQHFSRIIASNSENSSNTITKYFSIRSMLNANWI